MTDRKADSNKEYALSSFAMSWLIPVQSLSDPNADSQNEHAVAGPHQLNQVNPAGSFEEHLYLIAEKNSRTTLSPVRKLCLRLSEP